MYTRQTALEPGRGPDATTLGDAHTRLAAIREQVPPAYSAKKVDGEVAYKAARRDAPLVLPPRYRPSCWVPVEDPPKSTL